MIIFDIGQFLIQNNSTRNVLVATECGVWVQKFHESIMARGDTRGEVSQPWLGVHRHELLLMQANIPEGADKIKFKITAFGSKGAIECTVDHAGEVAVTDGLEGFHVIDTKDFPPEGMTVTLNIRSGPGMLVLNSYLGSKNLFTNPGIMP